LSGTNKEFGVTDVVVLDPDSLRSAGDFICILNSIKRLNC
jgi:hypothetical protein